MSLSKKETQDAKNAQAKADYIAAVNREQGEWEEEHKKEEAEFDEKHSIKTPEDAKRFIQECKDKILAQTSKMQHSKPGKEGVETAPKKKCLNCGYSKWLVQQYDETKSTKKNIVWTDEYLCTNCKERMRL